MRRLWCRPVAISWSAAYMDHTKKMRELANQFTPAVEALGCQFGQLVEEAKVRLGSLFRSEDYPAPEELFSEFSFEARVMPLPDGPFYACN